MTGLDENVDSILEVAIVLTDVNLKPVETLHHVIFQPKSVLDNMNDWCKKNHGESGLTAAVPSGTPLDQVENAILDLINRHYSPQDRVVLVGNSVSNDKRFVDRYMLKFAKRLHYRVIDVSSFKEVFRERYELSFQKKNSHRAIDDIHESIQELAYYLSYVQAPSPGSQTTGKTS